MRLSGAVYAGRRRRVSVGRLHAKRSGQQQAQRRAGPSGAASSVVRQVSSSPARAAALAQRTAPGVELFAVLIDLLRQRRPLPSWRPWQSLLEDGDLVLEHLDLLLEWSAGIPHRRRRVLVAAVPVGIDRTAASHRSILSSRSPTPSRRTVVGPRCPGRGRRVRPGPRLSWTNRR